MLQLLTLKLVQSLKRIDDLLILQSGGQEKGTYSVAPQNQTAAFDLDNNAYLNNTSSVQEEAESKKDSSTSPDHNKSTIGLATMAGLLQGDDHERKWVQYVKKIYNTIHNMEKQKYLEPKFSLALQPLLRYLQKKHLGAGSAITNISLLSQSQREDAVPQRLTSSLFGLMSNFNETFSVGSLISGNPDQSIILGLQRTSMENEMQSTSKSKGPQLLVDDQRHNSSNDGGILL